jgi:hypothetical protein
MAKALGATGLQTKQLVTVANAVTLDITMKPNAKVVVGRPLKDGETNFACFHTIPHCIPTSDI